MSFSGDRLGGRIKSPETDLPTSACFAVNDTQRIYSEIQNEALISVTASHFSSGGFRIEEVKASIKRDGEPGQPTHRNRLALKYTHLVIFSYKKKIIKICSMFFLKYLSKFYY